MSQAPPLPKVSRFVTGVREDGKSIFHEEVGETPPTTTLSDGMTISTLYATQSFPVELSDDADIAKYQDITSKPLSIGIDNGCTTKIVTFPPGYASPMHRSLTLNFNHVIAGEVEVILDSGETRKLKAGDSIVQRAINHSWKNTSQTEWARITATTLPIAELTIGGNPLGEVAGLPPAK